MRKDCRIWTCICGEQFLGRKAYYKHRNHCDEHIVWRNGRYKRQQKTIQEKFAKMTDEEKRSFRKKVSEIQKKVWGSPELRKKHLSEQYLIIFGNIELKIQ